ncbi:MAG: flagellar biosynthetic protein FliO [Proteobacteria bacterium]|nr:flagellar biosynthetic protein FliO [Pseudomonadota bacterium]
MNRCLTPLACIALMFCPTGTSAREGKPTVAAAAVESTELAEIVRLVVSPPLDNLSYKIVCGEESIRVRLNGVASRRKRAESLPVPKQGPMKKVRIASRGSAGSVVQIFPWFQPLDACSRTTLVTLGGEIIISFALSSMEIARQEKILKSSNKAVTRERDVSPALYNRSANEAGQPQLSDKDKKRKATKKATKKETAPLFPLTASKKSKGQSKASNSGQLGLSDTDIESDAVRFMAGFGFAAIVAGLALYLKRRKQGMAVSGDTIEILSSKRLGARQQLVLASVQDTKFLLAIGEKSVSTLGIVPDGSQGLPPTKALPNAVMNRSDELELSFNELVGNEPPRPVENSADEKQGTSEHFQKEFKSAIRAALAADDLPAQSEDGLSNAAGLIAMARMRADLKQKAKQTPVVEA